MRADFSPSVRATVAGRAGFRCSFPGCAKPTIGPGASPNETCSVGVAAHIYAASPRGPRLQGSLTESELTGLGNAIWLCETHAKMVDTNRGDKFAPSTLLGYRDLHEFKVSRQLGNLPDLHGWIDEIRASGGRLEATYSIQLGKATVFRGVNGSGKTMVCDWIAGTQSTQTLRSWRATLPAPELSMHLVHRDGASRVSLIVHQAGVMYAVDGSPVPFNPLDFRVVYLREDRGGDDPSWISRIAAALAVDRDRVEGLTPWVSGIPGSFIRTASLVDGDLWLDVGEGELRFGLLSAGEQSLVFIEYALALAAIEARFRPTLLCVDAGVGVLDGKATAGLVARLSTSAFAFQTIVVTTDERAEFFGWQAYDFRRSGQTITIAPSYE